MVQIAIDVSNLHGNRTFPSMLPAWMVVLDTTLGARQAFYKAPRNSDRPLSDENTFTKNDFWNLLSCKPSQPLAVSNLTILYYFCFFVWVCERVWCLCLCLYFFVFLFVVLLFWVTWLGEYMTPESGTFFSHEQGRSLTVSFLNHQDVG